MRYLVVVERGPTSYGAYVPDLPGCIAAGDTRDEVLELIREAIEFHLEGLAHDGEPIPPPASSGELVEVAAAQPVIQADPHRRGRPMGFLRLSPASAGRLTGALGAL